MTAPIVQIRDLTYTHLDGTVALNNISLDIAHGQNLVILGPNGSGKTTLALHLNGTLLSRAAIRVCGIEVAKKTLPEVRRRVGLVFQNAEDQLFMPTVLDDVMFGPLNHRVPTSEARVQAEQSLEKVQIHAGLFGRSPHHLSAGEKRRVAIAGVLAMNPDLIVLDEPTTSLDPPGQRLLAKLLSELPQTLVVCTHEVPFAKALAERAIFLEAGRIMGDGPVEDIATRFQWYPFR